MFVFCVCVDYAYVYVCVCVRVLQMPPPKIISDHFREILDSSHTLSLFLFLACLLFTGSATKIYQNKTKK